MVTHLAMGFLQSVKHFINQNEDKGVLWSET